MPPASSIAPGPALRRLRAALPEGRTLPGPEWERRHRWMLALLWANVAGLVAFALLCGLPVVHALLDGLPVAAFAVAARRPAASRKVRGSLACVGLLTASAMAVHLSGGYVEAHFHFFVVVVVLALYEDWTPFLLAFGFVVLHHGVGGVAAPELVYNHEDAIAHPWKWALIHGGFVAAAGVFALVSWRLNEVLRSAQSAALERATVSEEAFRSAFEDAIIGMALTAPDGRLLKVNPALCGMLGRPEGELLGTPWTTLTVPADRAAAAVQVRRCLDGLQESFTLEERYLHAGGGVVSASIASRLVRGRDGAPLHFVTQVTDVTAEREAAHALAHQALHDGLTGLPNRTLVLDRLEHALARAARRGARCAVVFADVDRFKHVNDGLGHAAGDELLVQIAGRLREALRETDTVGRFGGDEFVVLLEDVETGDAAGELTDRLRRALLEPFTLAGQEHFVTASFGLVVAAPGATAAGLLQDADAAMYRAKQAGGARWVRFDEAMRDSAERRVRLGLDLRRGLREDQFVLHFQPIFALDRARIAGSEALVRWEHPDLGLVPPGDFIGIAEESGLIVELGQWVLRAACVQAARWRVELGGDAPLPVHVNVAARQLAEPDLAATFAAILAETGVGAADVVLEITESALVEPGGDAASRLHELRALGLRIALDDFGTGYSSLSYLQGFPIDGLKIDRSFVARLGGEGGDPAVVTAILGIAASLGIHVVAEGVETDEQLEALRALGCDAAQGYLLGRPVPPADVDARARR